MSKQAPSEPAEETNKSWKIGVLLVIFLLAFSGILVRLFIIQIVKSGEYRALARKQYESRIELKPERGRIYDRNGHVIASTIKSASFAVDPHLVEHPRTIALALEMLTGDSAAVWEQKIRTSQKSFLWLARGNIDRLSLLDTLQDKGLIKVTEPRRNYLFGNAASQIVGCTSVDNQGLSGVELALDSLLRGEGGFMIMQRDGRGNLRPSVDLPTNPASNGHSVQLTLDIELQRIAEYELQRGIADAQAMSGTIIALDPATGEVLAVASSPSFNPNRPATASQESMRIRAITDMYEPGSTFKLITAAAAIEEKTIRGTDTVDAHHGVWKLSDGYEIKDSHPLGRITFAEAIEQSSNVVFALQSQKIPDDKFYKYARDFGFGITLGIDVPGEVSGRMKKPREFDGATKYFMAYGYELAATALQIVNAYSAVANGGVMMKPYLIKKILDENGNEIESYSPQKIRRVISPETAKELTELFCGVVERGTGVEARVQGMRIAGKTGTAQQLVDGTYSKKAYTASFVGFFPADKPKIAMMIMLDKPQTDIYGGKTAAPIFRRIAQRWISATHIEGIKDEILTEQSDSVTVPDVRGISVENAEVVLHQLGLRLKNRGQGIIAQQSPLPAIRVVRGSEILAESRVPTPQVVNTDSTEKARIAALRPDVRGMTVRRALAVLHAAGTKVKVIGSGSVQRQTWAPGKEKSCTIECK
ncbi:MAG: penicillin-binding transpeptidase domain-containing protein [Candidatus Kapaibacterium sp.]